MPSKIKDTNNDINDTNTNKLTTAGGCKREVDVLLMLVAVIIGKGSNKDAISIRGPIIGIGLLCVGAISASIKKIVKSKIVKVLTKTKNTNKMAAGQGPKK